MPTGSGLWHFLYRLVRKFIRSVVSSEKTWQLRHIIMMHFGNGDKPNVLTLLGSAWDWRLVSAFCYCIGVSTSATTV